MGLLSWLGWGRGPSGRGKDASESAAASPVAASGDAWREVPPVQRMTGGGVGLVTDPVGFRGSLSTWQNVSLTGELGHHVDEAAPGGVGHQLATPSVQTFAPPAVQRHRSGAGGGSDSGGGYGVDEGGGPGREVGSGATSESASWTSSPSAPVPVAVQRVAGPAPAAGEVSLPVVRRLAVVQPDPPVAPGDPGVPPPAARSGLGRGLGEPLTGLPPTAQRDAVARSTASGVDPDAAAAPLVPEEATTAPLLGDAPSFSVREQEGEGGAGEASLPGEGAESQVAGGFDVPPASGFSAVGSTGSPAAVPAFSAVPLQRIATDESPPGRVPDVLPLVAQRSVTVLPSWEHPAVEPSPSPASVPVRWSDEGERSADAPALAPAHTPAPTPESAVRRPDAAPPAVQRSAAPAAPPPRPADAGAVAIAAGIAQRMADGSVVFRSSAAPASSFSTFPSPPPAVQRDADSAEPPVPEAEFTPSFDTSEQPEPVSDPDADADAEAAPASGAGPAAAPEQSTDADGASPKVTDELVRALFAPLSRLLRAELRLERERSGRLINTRH